MGCNCPECREDRIKREIRPTGMVTDEVCDCGRYANATNDQNYVYCLSCQKPFKRKGI